LRMIDKAIVRHGLLVRPPADQAFEHVGHAQDAAEDGISSPPDRRIARAVVPAVMGQGDDPPTA
jgi:hypothetical protein